jgi:hypothetical protein
MGHYTHATDTNKQIGSTYKISDQQNAILEDQRQELADLQVLNRSHPFHIYPNGQNCMPFL